MRNKRFNFFTWLIIILFFIGFIQLLIDRPSTILVPLIFFSLFYYFYRNPDKLNINRKRQFKHSSHHPKKKDYPFKVIKGNKDDEYNGPKYH